MLSIDSISKGVVIDHIKAGKSMEIYKYLNLEQLECPVAIIKNVKSVKCGKKDIIKIENNIDIDLDVLGYLDPTITINIIENGIIKRKETLSLPEKITNVVKCKNPRCITSIEQEIAHIFKLCDSKHGVYRCIYCEEAAKRNWLYA